MKAVEGHHGLEVAMEKVGKKLIKTMVNGDIQRFLLYIIVLVVIVNGDIVMVMVNGDI